MWTQVRSFSIIKIQIPLRRTNCHCPSAAGSRQRNTITQNQNRKTEGAEKGVDAGVADRKETINVSTIK